MKFSVILDSVHSVIAPSETDEGFTWKQAVQEIVEYCQECGNDLQAEYFEVVANHKDEYLSGAFPLFLA